MSWQRVSVVPVWLLTLAGAITIGVAAPRDEYYTWLGVVMAAAVIVTFVLQLSTSRPEGFVVRAMASIGVSVIILAAATVIHALGG